MSTSPARNGKKWSVNETLRLQREYELLELNVNEIASLHSRTIESILFRLVKEGFAEDFDSVRGYSKPPTVEPVPVVCPKTAFSCYVDTLLTEKVLTLKDIQECINEKVEQTSKKATPVKKSKRVLRQYLNK